MTFEGAAPSVFFLGGGRSDTKGVSPQSVGAKAYNLMRMDRIGLPVPAGFVLGTTFAREIDETSQPSEKLRTTLAENILRLEAVTGWRLDSARYPLVVSVRSGAPVSMPGMLGTVLNVGLNDRTVHGLIRRTGNPRTAWDSYRRLIQSFTEVACGFPGDPFDRLIQQYLDEEALPTTAELDRRQLQAATRGYLDIYHSLTGDTFPQDPFEQLAAAVAAVFKSWEGDKAQAYRKLKTIDEAIGVAVTVQTMVFGNAGGESGSGVGFTRNPATGKDELYVDFLFNAQGEDVVGGHRPVSSGERLLQLLPDLAIQLERVRRRLEAEFHDMQDFEFTVEEGRLYLLQTRRGKRTPWAALRIAVDLLNEGLIDPSTAVKRLEEYNLDVIGRSRLDRKANMSPVATAIPASVGVAIGRIALDSEHAKAMAEAGDAVVLVRDNTSTADLPGLAVAEGVLTRYGGRTSHAAVVAREMGRVCLVGCHELRIDVTTRQCTLGANTLKEGDYLSLDGETGNIYEGQLQVIHERPYEALAKLESWCSTAPHHLPPGGIERKP